MFGGSIKCEGVHVRTKIKIKVPRCVRKTRVASESAILSLQLRLKLIVCGGGNKWFLNNTLIFKSWELPEISSRLKGRDHIMSV